MDEKYAIWNNTIKKQLPEAWNNRSDTPASWRINEGSCSLWEATLSLPAEWGKNKSSPDMWHHVETPPCGWGTELHLRNDWGSPACRPPSVRGASSRNNDADKPGSGIDFSSLARSGAGKLSGIAGKVGSAAKSAAGSALDHARSDEMKNRLSSVKDKAGALAGSAGSSLKNIKDGAGDFVYKYRPAKKGNTSAEGNEVLAPVDEAYEDADTAVTSYTDNAADEQDYGEITADEGYEQASAETPENEYRSERGKGPSWARSAASNPYARTNDNYAPAYEAPDSYVNYSYAKQKKSPVVFVLLGVIGVLILGVGLLGGMLLMKNKDEKNNSITPAAVTDTMPQQASTEDINDTNIAECLEAYREILRSYMCSAEYNSNSAYELYDVDDNGIPELFVSEGEFHTAATTVYTFNNGQCIKLLDQNNTDGTLYLLPQNHYLVYYTSYYGKTSLDVYSLNNNELIVIEKFYDDSYQYSSPENDVVYMHNGENVTMESYKSAMDKYNRADFIEVGRSNSFDDIDSYFNSLINNSNTTGAAVADTPVTTFSNTALTTTLTETTTIKTTSSEPKKESTLSEQELGYMYNMFFIASIHGYIGGGYIEDYDNDGTDEAILSTANGGYQIVKYQNGELVWSSYPNGREYSYGQQLPNMKTTFYGHKGISERCRELAVSHGFTSNQYFTDQSSSIESVDAYTVTFTGTIIGYVKTSDRFSSLNLRSEPSTNSNIITQLPNGTLFNVISAYDSNGFETSFMGGNPVWYFITVNLYGTNYSGYVYGEYACVWDNAI